MSDATDDATRVRAYLLEEHRTLVQTTLECADAVAATRDETGDPSERFERLLRSRGVVDALPDVLVEAVDVLGATLPATPVPAPPYVVVTRAGPVARATLPDRGRLVLGVDAFVRRGGVWVRSAEPPETALSVELR